MVNAETTGISGNAVNEKLVSQKKEVNVKTSSDGTVSLCVSPSVSESIVRKILFFQNIDMQNDIDSIFSFDQLIQHGVLLENPSPADLDSDPGRDYVESAFSNTTSDIVLLKKFIFITQDQINRVNTTAIRGVISASIRIASATGTAYLDKVELVFEGKTKTGDVIFPIGGPNLVMTPAISNNTNSFITTSGQGFTAFESFPLGSYYFCVKVQIYAHVDASTTTALVRLNTTRGSADSYVEVPFVI